MTRRAWYWLVVLALAGRCAGAPLTVAALPETAYNAVGIPLVTELYQRAGVEVNIIEIPAPRQSRMLRLGQIDAVLSHPDGFSQNFPQLIQLPYELSQVQLSLFTARDDLEWPLPAGLSVGLIRGITNADGGAPIMKTLNVIEVDSRTQMLRMLARQRLDLALLPRIEGLATIQELGLAGVRPIGPTQAEVPVYHYLHERHRNLVEPLTAVMKEWTDNGYMEDKHQRFRDELEAAIGRQR